MVKLRDQDAIRVKNCEQCDREMNWHTEFRHVAIGAFQERKYCSRKCSSEAPRESKLISKECLACGKEIKVIPARINTHKYCSLKCSNSHRKRELKVKDIERVKNCKNCGREMNWFDDEFRHKPMATWEKMKFCSKQCADEGGLRYQGEEHPNWNPDKTSRTGQQKWVNAVHAKNDYICQHCGADPSKEDTYLVAHHIESWAENEELRFDVSNGMTLCVPCHDKVHYGELNYDEDEVIKRVTPSSMSRRVKVQCSNCNVNLYRTPTSLIHHPSRKPKKFLFCDKKCMGEHISKNRSGKNSHLYLKRIKLKCDHCGKEIYKRPKQLINSKTGIKWEKQFCDIDCRKNYKIERVEVECFSCSKKIYRRPAQLRNYKTGIKFKKHYCDMTCRSNSK